MKKKRDSLGWLLYPWIVCIALRYGVELPAAIG